MKEKQRIGWIGERYVQFKLSSLGINSINLPPEFDFDIYTDNNIRIEVKTSMITTIKDIRNKDKSYIQKKYQFLNYSWSNGKMVKRMRECDFYILVCLDDDMNIVRSYIIPKDIIKDKKHISIPAEIKRKGTSPIDWESYEDDWDNILSIKHKDNVIDN